jgi:hypothetical protein
VGTPNPFYRRALAHSVVSRGPALAYEGNGLAWTALERAGYKVNFSPFEDNSAYGTLLATKHGIRFLIQVKTRHKFKRDGTLNKRYRLTTTRTGRLSEIVSTAEKTYNAKAHWIAVQIDLSEWKYSVYFGSIQELHGRESIPMAPSDRDYYSCLADNEEIPMPVVRTYPPEIQDSLKEFVTNHPDPSKVAFIMMQFGNTPAHNKIAEAIRGALGKHEIKALRADDRQYHDDLLTNILTYIYGCGFGVAVYERILDDQSNPNVAFEVGYMLGLGKQVCLLKDQTMKDLHADLRGRLYRQFDPQKPKTGISEQLKKWAQDRGFIPAAV